MIADEKPRGMTFLLWTLLVVAIAAAVLGVTAVMSWRAPELGPVAGRLRPCPPTPNCVCSEDVDARHAVDALRPRGDLEQVLGPFIDALAARPRVKLLSATTGYAHLEFRSKAFRFADDVELLVDFDAGVIHVRSASRVGYSDLGANRARVQELREALAELEGR